MARDDDNSEILPPRIQAAFRVLHLARLITEQVDSSIPMRALTPLEKSVETSALRAIQQYVLGEMDFADERSAAAANDRRSEETRSDR